MEEGLKYFFSLILCLLIFVFEWALEKSITWFGMEIVYACFFNFLRRYASVKPSNVTPPHLSEHWMKEKNCKSQVLISVITFSNTFKCVFLKIKFFFKLVGIVGKFVIKLLTSNMEWSYMRYVLIFWIIKFIIYLLFFWKTWFLWKSVVFYHKVSFLKFSKKILYRWWEGRIFQVSTNG